MSRARALLFLLPAVWLAAPAAAQPDRTAALEKARTKFEADISKSEEALVASIDKALKAAQTAKDRTLADKLTYERDVFVKHRITPTAVPQAATYVKQRASSVTALEAAYRPAIKELIKAKKDEEADALETALNNMVKSARGYGLALPDLEGRAFLIEHTPSGLVIETAYKGGRGELVLGPKVGKTKKDQCWLIEREEKGFVVRNVASGRVFHAWNMNAIAGQNLGVAVLERTSETPRASLFTFAEDQRDVVFSIVSNGLVLTAIEKKQKGVTNYGIVQAKKETPAPPSQRWTIVEAK
jgi:hypothetical protein